MRRQKHGVEELSFMLHIKGKNRKQGAVHSAQKPVSAHLELGQGVVEGVEAAPDVGVLGLARYNLERLKDVDNVVDAATLDACVAEEKGKGGGR